MLNATNPNQGPSPYGTQADRDRGLDFGKDAVNLDGTDPTGNNFGGGYTNSISDVNNLLAAAGKALGKANPFADNKSQVQQAIDKMDDAARKSDLPAQQAIDTPLSNINVQAQPEPSVAVEGNLDNRSIFAKYADLVANNPVAVGVPASILDALTMQIGGKVATAGVASSREAQEALGLDIGSYLNVDRTDPTPTISLDEGFPDITDDNYGSGDGDLMQRLRDFVANPTYAGIPDLDTNAALGAYNNAIGGIDSLLGERGFEGLGYAQEARDRVGTIFDSFAGGDDYDSLLNELLGRNFGETALTNTQNRFIGEGTDAISSAFPDDAFQSLDDGIIDSIVGERLSGAQGQVANAGARGNLNEAGSLSANETLLGQQEGARERVGEVGGGVLGGFRNDIQGIQDRATTANEGFLLGDDRFDVTPFSTERSSLVDNTDLTGAVRTSLGSEPLFGVSDALLEGGRSQGLVSGTGGTSSLLDTIASRQQGTGTDRTKRGLGSKGSGAF